MQIVYEVIFIEILENLSAKLFLCETDLKKKMAGQMSGNATFDLEVSDCEHRMFNLLYIYYYLISLFYLVQDLERI